MDPLELLPAELWRMIFEKVEDGQDWLNLYRASPTFEGVVGEDRTLALLTQVYPLVRKHLNKSLSEVLPLRLVSKQWKKVVDTSLEPSEYEFGDPTATFCNLKLGDIGRNYDFKDTRTISKFLDKFGTHPGNPFIGGFVMLSLHDRMRAETEAMMKFRHSVERLMARFGNQISKLCIICSHENRSDFNMLVDEFRSCVELAPNLEKLFIMFHDRTDGVGMRPGNPNLGSQSFPVIARLKSFFFAGYRETGSWVGMQNILIRHCCNPDSLKTASMVGVPMELTTFPNLETATVAISSSRVQEDISNLMNSAWPLTRLTLAPHGTRCIPLNSIIVECIEHFKETLTSLWIGDDWEDPQPNSELRLNLPRLKYLIIHHRYWSFLSLGSLPSLEKLRIFGCHVPPEEEGVHFFQLLEAQFSVCKMCKMPPKLRKIEVAGWQHDWDEPPFGGKEFCRVYYREQVKKEV